MWGKLVMIFRLFVFLFGFGLAISGGISIIAYLNLLTTGSSFSEYLMFISHRLECYLFVIGIVLISLSIYYPTRDPWEDK